MSQSAIFTTSDLAAALTSRDVMARRLRDQLVGFSGRSIDQHLQVWAAAEAELAAIRAAYPTASWSPSSAPAPGAVQSLLDTPIAELQLSLEDGRLGSILARLRAELATLGIAYWPNFYLGDDDFWTTDRATSINVPWFLGSGATWAVVNDQGPRYTEDDVLRVLRHEYAHALLYAYRAWEKLSWAVTRGMRPLWADTFGDIDAPYHDAYVPDASAAADFVRHLDRPGAAQNVHYAQKHPDEDWAETFAVYLGEPDWRDDYPDGTGAREKLEAVDTMVRQSWFAGDPATTRLGRPNPYRQIQGTVGEYVGAAAGLDGGQRAALLRREPAVQASAALHQLYFEALGTLMPGAAATGGAPGPLMAMAAHEAYGSVGSFLFDLRAACAAADGWVLVAWDRAARKIRNCLTAGGVPPLHDVLLAICLHEHAYVGDYGPGGKHLYVGAVLRCINWAVVEQRACDAADTLAEVMAKLFSEQNAAYAASVDVPDPGAIT